MNAKLIVALIATLIAASAHAEQKFGRDSVYASKDGAVSKSASGATIARHGRDSVYATSTPASKQAVKVVADVAYKAGRS